MGSLRRVVAGLVLVVTGVLAWWAGGPGAVAAPTAVSASASASASGPALPSVIRIDGARVGWLPARLGRPSRLDFDFGDVRFASVVWASAAPAGGDRSDGEVLVVRGARLRTANALRAWFLHYQQRPRAWSHYRPLHVHGRPGWTSLDQVFWLVRPGVAVSVQLDHARWPHRTVLRVARSVRLRS